jgi:hypothetical protein
MPSSSRHSPRAGVQRESRRCSSSRVVSGSARRLLRNSASRPQLDDQFAIQGFRDPQQGVDSGWTPSGLETCDCRLRRAAQLGELGLGELSRSALLGHLRGNGGEEPPLIRIDVGEPFAQPLERAPAFRLAGSHI